jgi:N-acetylmuramoyl-L-alanine amidase
MVKKIFIIIVILINSIPLSSQEGLRKVAANTGDGILSLLRKNGLSPSYMDDFIQLNKKLLGPDNSLYTGKIYFLPEDAATDRNTTSVRKVTFPIFGLNYQEIKVKSNVLKGAVYYLKSGHGGPDPGAMGKFMNHTLCEDEYAYDVILRLGRNLIENGATVYFIIRDPDDGIRDEQFLTADKNEVCYPNLEIPLNQVQRLKQRTNAINKLYSSNKGKFQRMISIHVDSRSKGKNIDVFFYYDKLSKKGDKAARILKNTFQEKYQKNQPDRGYKGTVSARDLYVVTHTKPVSVYIELGNIHHARDQQRIVHPDNRQALANWLTVGLIKDHSSNR